MHRQGLLPTSKARQADLDLAPTRTFPPLPWPEAGAVAFRVPMASTTWDRILRMALLPRERSGSLPAPDRSSLLWDLHRALGITTIPSLLDRADLADPQVPRDPRDSQTRETDRLLATSPLPPSPPRLAAAAKTRSLRLLRSRRLSRPSRSLLGSHLLRARRLQDHLLLSIRNPPSKKSRRPLPRWLALPRVPGRMERRLPLRAPRMPAPLRFYPQYLCRPR